MDQLTKRALHEERDALLEQVNELKAEAKALKQNRKIEEEQIAHKIAMREGDLEIAQKKAIADIERKADERVAKVKDEYRDKLEKQLATRGDELKEMYKEILARLPDVNLAIEQRSERTT